MLKRIREWRPFNRREPTVTDEEHWHSAEQLYGVAETLLARHRQKELTEASSFGKGCSCGDRRCYGCDEEHVWRHGTSTGDLAKAYARTFLPADVAELAVERQLNPYEIAAVRCRWRQRYYGPDNAHIAVEFD